MNATIRNYRAGDDAAAYHICMMTGDNGKDGSPFYVEDPDALARIYVGPYLKFSPEFSLMLEDDQGVCGYSLGTLDSREFFDRYEREWRPGLVKQFPDPIGDSAAWTRVQQVHHTYHHPDYFCPEPYAQYPSHLHIDFLSRARGKGYGRKMIEEMLRRLRDAGSPGVHLGMSIVNDPAYAFYLALGFQELTRNDDTIYMGMTL